MKLAQCILVLIAAGVGVAAPTSSESISGGFWTAEPTTWPTNSPTLSHWSRPTGYPGSGSDEPAREAQQRAAAVKEAFEFAWDGYYRYAFPNDELLPVNNSFSNSRNGWGASSADALSTAVVMNLPDIYNVILDHITKINWSVSYENDQVSLFETTIRYLGGILSGYDLLSGPLSHYGQNRGILSEVLDQAQHLANNLSFAFETSTGIPYNNLYFNNRSNDGSTTNGLATIGTLVLEWTRLSDLTGNATYAELAQKGESYLLAPQPQPYAEPFPGLVGSDVGVQNGSFVDNNGGWQGGRDSFYEYLLKMYIYDSTRFSEYRDRWIAAVDSSITYLASHPSTRPDLTFLAEFEGQNLIFDSEHLACFDGGNFILGGLVLDKAEYIDFGLSLVDSCEDVYNQTLTGIGPESFSWNATAVPANQTAFFERAGFWIVDSEYILRPEVIESFYYAYRATGSRVYQDFAWNAFVAINATTRVGSGFSEITNVNAPAGGKFTNFQDSFLFAEVMKYSFLIHAPDAEYQVNYHGKNEFVFNTEGHPLKVFGPPL